MAIVFRPLNDEEKEFVQIHKWCKKKHVYEWFEQRLEYGIPFFISLYKFTLSS